MAPPASPASSSTSTSVFRRRILFFLLSVCLSYARSSNSTATPYFTTNTTYATPTSTVTTTSTATHPVAAYSAANATYTTYTTYTTTETTSTTTAKYASNDPFSANCTPAAIEQFPRDLFSPGQRERGAIAVHILVSLYLILALGTICDDYFVPVLEIICDKLNLAPDVAGATFMAAGTSSPEFFTNVMGTFVTESDLGIGTIVGSAVFNIFGVIAVCGIFSGRKIHLDWYPITRDCLIYGVTVVILVIVLIDEQVHWYEALVMVLFYLAYIVLMFLNPGIERWSHRMQRKLRAKVGVSVEVDERGPDEHTPLHTAAKSANNNNDGKTIQVPLAQAESMADSVDGDDGGAKAQYPWHRPQGEGFWAHAWWLLLLPQRLLFFFTVPDVRFDSCSNLFPLSFLMCVAWIGAISYVLTWMITLIGFTFNIPDSVMGLSFLAVGTSVPEVFSSLIVCRHGKGSMAVSNSIGSNTFDILLCLGLPWMIKAVINGVEDEWMIQVNSSALAYTVITLLVSLVILYVLLLTSRFVLSRTLGLACLVIYAIFLSISLLFELNVFYLVNLPMCQSSY